MPASLLHATFVSTLLFAMMALPSPGEADETPWSKAAKPSNGTPAAIGGYSRGCVAGAVALSSDAKGIAIAKPKRKRHYGHPSLVAFVTELGRTLATKSLGGIVVGDLSQPRGGPAPGGHASHQSGLDADIWFHWPGRPNGTLATNKRNKLDTASPKTLVSDNGKTTPEFTSRIHKLLRLATEDIRVARIFVNPSIKKRLCDKSPPKDRAWLRKIRPWWGHKAHFHTRLHCPKNSKSCVPQAKLPKGDGCDLSWWFRKDMRASRTKGRAKYRKGVGAAPILPDECQRIQPKRR